MEQVASTPWLREVHMYLRDLLTRRAPNGSRQRLGLVARRNPALRDVAVVRPRVLLYGQSTAPQTGGRGNVHVLFDLAVGRFRGDRVALARWVCGGRSTFPRLSTDRLPGDRCRRCDGLSIGKETPRG